MKDLRFRDVEIQISRDGTRLWVNTAEDGCVLRVYEIGKLVIVDERVDKDQ